MASLGGGVPGCDLVACLLRVVCGCAECWCGGVVVRMRCVGCSGVVCGGVAV